MVLFLEPAKYNRGSLRCQGIPIILTKRLQNTTGFESLNLFFHQDLSATVSFLLHVKQHDRKNDCSIVGGMKIHGFGQAKMQSYETKQHAQSELYAH